MPIQETLKALADPTRREILLLLREGERTAGEIAQQLGIAPSALSHHLQKLRSAGLLEERREKNFIYYELNTSLFEELLLWLEQFPSRKEDGNEGSASSAAASDRSAPSH